MKVGTGRGIACNYFLGKRSLPNRSTLATAIGLLAISKLSQAYVNLPLLKNLIKFDLNKDELFDMNCMSMMQAWVAARPFLQMLPGYSCDATSCQSGYTRLDYKEIENEFCSYKTVVQMPGDKDSIYGFAVYKNPFKYQYWLGETFSEIVYGSKEGYEGALQFGDEKFFKFKIVPQIDRWDIAYESGQMSVTGSCRSTDEKINCVLNFDKSFFRFAFLNATLTQKEANLLSLEVDYERFFIFSSQKSKALFNFEHDPSSGKVSLNGGAFSEKQERLLGLDLNYKPWGGSHFNISSSSDEYKMDFSFEESNSAWVAILDFIPHPIPSCFNLPSYFYIFTSKTNESFTKKENSYSMSGILAEMVDLVPTRAFQFEATHKNYTESMHFQKVASDNYYLNSNLTLGKESYTFMANSTISSSKSSIMLGASVIGNEKPNDVYTLTVSKENLTIGQRYQIIYFDSSGRATTISHVEPHPKKK